MGHGVNSVDIIHVAVGIVINAVVRDFARFVYRLSMRSSWSSFALLSTTATIMLGASF